MAGGGQIGGAGGLLRRALWIFVCASVVVAMLGDVPKDPNKIFADLSAKSAKLEQTVNGWVDAIGLTKDGSKPDVHLPGSKPNTNGPGEPGQQTNPTNGGSGSDGASPTAAEHGKKKCKKTKKHKGKKHKKCKKKPTPSPPAPTNPPTSPPTPPAGLSAAEAALARLKVAPLQDVDYDRDEWRHWDNLTPCWTVREQVLVRDANPGSLTLLDQFGNTTTDHSKACEVAGGVWVDPYTKATFTNPSDLDIDHVVPLGNAASSGGQGWDEDKKRDYANYLGYNRHLWAVSASANRSKGDKSPDIWQPINGKIQCEYGTAWVLIKDRWSLTITTAEKSTLAEMLSRC